MDYNQNQANQNQYQQNTTFQSPGLTMASVSLVLGIGSLFTSPTVFLPFILGSLAIVFALLSKGYSKRLVTQAKVGLGCGLAGLAMVSVLTFSSYAMVLSHPEMLIEAGQQYDAAYEAANGRSTEDDFGMSFEDMMNDFADKLQR